MAPRSVVRGGMKWLLIHLEIVEHIMHNFFLRDF